MLSIDVLNDEATRKWLQSVKRLMTFCQTRYPATFRAKMVRIAETFNLYLFGFIDGLSYACIFSCGCWPQLFDLYNTGLFYRPSLSSKFIVQIYRPNLSSQIDFMALILLKHLP